MPRFQLLSLRLVLSGFSVVLTFRVDLSIFGRYAANEPYQKERKKLKEKSK